MLSAFTARPVVELKPRDKSKIECILAYGDRLLVGLNTGSLRIYRVNELPEDGTTVNGNATNDSDNTLSRPSSSSTTKPVDLLRDLEKFSTRPVEQLAIIKEANVLISLSNYSVSLHDLQSYGLQEQLTKAKKASTFAVTSNIVKDAATGIPEIISRLAVAVNRKLCLWSWHEAELSHDVVEISLTHSIRTLTWSSATKIICGMNSGYVVVDVTSQEIEDIIGPGGVGGLSGAEGGRFGAVGSASMGYMGLGGYVPKPLMTRLGEGGMLLAKDINSLFIDSDGKPLEKRQVPWQQAPESIGYSYPYLISLQSGQKGVLEIRNPETLSLLQTVPLSNASQLHFPPPTVSLSHAGKGFHVVSDRSVWKMGATTYDSQIDELVEVKAYDEAISILGMLEDALLKDKQGRLISIKTFKAQMLFDQRKYRDSIDLFTSIEAPPQRVIKLFPKIIAGELSIIDGKKEEIEAENTDNDDLSSEATAEEKTIHTEEPSGSHKAATLSRFLGAHKKANSVDTASIRSSVKGDTGDISNSANASGTPVEDKALEGKDLITAARELNSFLSETRARGLKPYLDYATGKIRPEVVNGEIDRSKQSFQNLLATATSAEGEDLEVALRETAKLVDTTLFRSFMFASPSLAGPLFRLPNFCDPEVVGDRLLATGSYNDLVDFYHGKKLHRPALELLKKFGQTEQEDDAAPSLHGPQRTVSYLQNLPPEMIDLILEFAEWPLRSSPDIGMEIFLADTENAETLPRERVIEFLEGIDIELANRYLEHLINELNDATPDFHNRLVKVFIQALKERNDRDSDSWKDKMDRLLTLLRTSRQYSLSKAFGLIPREDPSFYEAQAVILSNMGQHKQALEVYVFKIKDFAKAEEYCNRIHLTQESPTSSPMQSRRASTSEPDDPLPSIYHTLLSLYLMPPPPTKPNWPPALELLSKHGSRLPAASTLNLIPASLPVADLASYFQGRIRSANSIVNEGRVVAGLWNSELISTQAMLLLGDGIPGGAGGRNRRVVVSEERVCGVCHKRLGQSVVAVLPDNAVVHYACSNRLGGRKSPVEQYRGAWGR